MGKFATRPSARFAAALLNARLWLSSWFARNRLAVAKPPKTYAVSSSTGHDALFPIHQATASWRLTTAKICGQVVQSGPYRSLICGYFSRISLLRFAWGSCGVAARAREMIQRQRTCVDGKGRQRLGATDSDGREVETATWPPARPVAMRSGGRRDEGRARAEMRDGRRDAHHPCSSRSRQTSSSRVRRSTWWIAPSVHARPTTSLGNLLGVGKRPRGVLTREAYALDEMDAMRPTEANSSSLTDAGERGEPRVTRSGRRW